MGPCSLILHPNPDDARRERIESYKAKVRALRVSNDVLKVVEDLDIPFFRRWFAESFGKECEKLNVLRRRCEELEFLQRAATDYYFFVGGSYPKALTKVLNAHAEGSLNQMLQNIAKEMEEDDAEFFGDVEDEDDFDDAFKSGFREIFGLEEDDAKNGWNDPHKANASKEFNNSSESSNDPFKNLYRKMAKKLHPDFNPDQSIEHNSLWHDLQSAYQWNDMDRLEEINRSINGQSAVGIDLLAISLGDLAKLTKDIAMKVRSVEQRIREEKKEEYWDFTRRRNQQAFLNRISSKIRKSIMHESIAFESMILETEFEFDRLRAAGKPRKKQPNKKSGKQTPKTS